MGRLLSQDEIEKFNIRVFNPAKVVKGKMFKVSYANGKANAAFMRQNLVSIRPQEEIDFEQILDKTDFPFEVQKYFRDRKSGELCFVDFFLTKQWIAIEIDGDYHSQSEQVRKDRERENLLLNKYKVSIIRFNHQQISKITPEYLTELIMKICNERRLKS